MVKIKNSSDQPVHLGNTVIPPSIPKLPEPFNTIVQNGWLDCIAAPCRRCTEKYFAEHPGESLTPEAPVWPKLVAHPDGPGRLGCDHHNDDWIFFGPAATDHDDTDYMLVISRWNHSQWPQELLAGRWEDTTYGNRTNANTIQSDGASYAKYVRACYKTLPDAMAKEYSATMTQQNPATSPFFKVLVNGRDVTERIRRETFHCAVSQHFVEFDLAHTEGDYTDGLNRLELGFTYPIITSGTPAPEKS